MLTPTILFLASSFSASSLISATTLHAQTVSTPAANAVATQKQILAPLLPGTGGEQGILKLDVVVTDNSGNPVSGLPRSAFTVLDNGQPNNILTFHSFDGGVAKANPAVEVILFLDSLDVPGKRAEFERQEVERFLRQHGGHLSQPTSVYGISRDGLWRLNNPAPNPAPNPASEGNTLADQLAQGKITHWIGNQGGARNGLAIRDNSPARSMGPATPAALLPNNSTVATLQGVSTVAEAARRRPGRKLLLWIGPGCCIGSGAHLKAPSRSDQKNLFDLAYWASTLFREAHLTLYTLSAEKSPAVAANGDIAGKPPDSQAPGIESPSIDAPTINAPKSPADTTWMSIHKESLALQSGGKILASNAEPNVKPLEVVNQINDVLREAEVFYMLSIDASHADHPDEYHSLKVEVNRPNLPGLTVRAKTGYYDQPWYIDGPSPELKPMTVAQVEAILKEDRGDRDAELAKQLSYIRLTECMSSPRLRNWSMVFRGKKTRAALMALADASAFLAPPDDEILKDPAPSAGDQSKMLSLVSNYLSETIPHLPNFFANRTIVAYEDKPEFLNRDSKAAFQPLHVVENAKATVLYRNGNEVVEAARKGATPEAKNLVTHGTFGPLLDYVTKPLATPGTLQWARWERGFDSRRAVFHWTVPAVKSAYGWGSCCLPDEEGTQFFTKIVGYTAEIAIDPDTGAILRFQLKSDFLSTTPPTTTPMTRSDIVIEYGNIEVGGTPYICPIRSIAISRIRSIANLKEWNQSFRTYGPYLTLLNDTTFDNYHRFRSDSRILIDPQPSDNP